MHLEESTVKLWVEAPVSIPTSSGRSNRLPLVPRLTHLLVISKRIWCLLRLGGHPSAMARSQEISQHVHEKKSPAHLFKCQPILLYCSQYDLNNQRPKWFWSSVMTITSSERAGKSINQKNHGLLFHSKYVLYSLAEYVHVWTVGAVNLWPHDRFEAVLRQNPRHNLGAA